ncbi:MAG: HPr family phosphocarrier protein [Planctomycetes bacterium]|nr:HPr family phosphocarrier protein [Planctomycetota bacterium]MBL7009090.1 HPr family phosphocarrier protein [Planctomycetota bacterium]
MSTVVREVTVVNEQGVHARPSHAIVECASRFQAEVALVHDGRRADARSILSVMTLGAVRGASVRIEASGDQAGEAAAALAELFDGGFAEQP